MTALGQTYLNIPVFDSTKVSTIPGKIEAEEYYRQMGVFGELTKDADGFMDIGYTDIGDWLKYKVSVTENGTYTLTTRYAGTNAGKFDVYLDDVKKGTVSTTNTGGWQTWSTATSSINLTAGEHILKLQVVASGFNLNWINFSGITTGLNETILPSLDASVYPNPVVDKKFKISFNSSCTDDITVQLYDLSGKTVYTENFGTLNASEININLNHISEIRKGIYILFVKCKEGSLRRKIAFI
jgi:hypothetical protein